MLLVKYTILLILFGCSTYIGILYSRKYLNRAKELKELQNALNIFITKIKFTYDPIPDIFLEIHKKIGGNIGKIFYNATTKMNTITAGDAWIYSLNTTQTNLNKEDLDILKGLSNLLGKVDIDGQVSEIELVENFLNTQIEKAEEEKKKYVKLYKTLGVTIGLAVVIILF
jgi:stage III sporulation protein AB